MWDKVIRTWRSVVWWGWVLVQESKTETKAIWHEQEWLNASATPKHWLSHNLPIFTWLVLDTNSGLWWIISGWHWGFSKMCKALLVTGPIGPLLHWLSVQKYRTWSLHRSRHTLGASWTVLWEETCYLRGRHCTEKKMPFMSLIIRHLLCIHYLSNIKCRGAGSLDTLLVT